METIENTVGATNGRMSMLFRINQILLPMFFALILGIGSWIFSQIWSSNTRLTTIEAWKSTGERFTADDGVILEKSFTKETTHIMGDVKDIKKLIERLNGKLDKHVDRHLTIVNPKGD